jgi:hydrogenase-4 membrane subunit HyfE
MTTPGSDLLVDARHLLFGVPLAFAFVLLTRRRVADMRQVARAQSVAVAVAVAATSGGWVGGAALPWAMAFAILMAGGVLVPFAARRAGRGEETEGATPLPVSAVAAALVVVAILVADAHGADSPRQDLGLALAAVLVALVACAARRSEAARLAGFWALANGVALVVSLDPAPTRVVAVAALFGFVGAGAVMLPPHPQPQPPATRAG